ncbi:hypothetical protein [Campylobacter sp.]|uniref:hypothetical protein n=1 Tax=Campylobacter sp. TaxID=205 RepID=UPI002AA70302|nr:hypothetical protein [Campylobacter sp.]
MRLLRSLCSLAMTNFRIFCDEIIGSSRGMTKTQVGMTQGLGILEFLNNINAKSP